jgi:hypothetical protein
MARSKGFVLVTLKKTCDWFKHEWLTDISGEINCKHCQAVITDYVYELEAELLSQPQFKPWRDV